MTSISAVAGETLLAAKKTTRAFRVFDNRRVSAACLRRKSGPAKGAPRQRITG